MSTSTLNPGAGAPRYIVVEGPIGAGKTALARRLADVDYLVDEGLARENVRCVQEARKQAGLEVTDRIVVGVSGSTTEASPGFRVRL